MATTADTPFPSSVPTRPANSRGNGRNVDAAPETSASSATGNSEGQGDVLNRVVQGAHQTIDRLAETAAPHAMRLQDGVASAGNLLHSRAQQAREMGSEWAETLRCTVRENPLAAIGTALALGVLVARLRRR